jgi:hypothetical protein
VSDQEEEPVPSPNGNIMEELRALDIHMKTSDEICQKFKTDPKRGLSNARAAAYLKRYGKNTGFEP